ncbi:MAG: hypothetical protein ACI9W4_000772 [Rhodothermales bacterium]|jgi:hypothetical protein
MKPRITLLVAFLIAPLLLAACASSGNTARQGLIRANLGTAARNVLLSETVDALTTRYGFLMLRAVVDTEDMRFETDWRQETALSDEQELGFTHARTKITITARPRNRSSSGAQNLAVSFQAETQVLPFGNEVWVSPSPTDMRKDAVDQISSFLRRSYQTALR